MPSSRRNAPRMVEPVTPIATPTAPPSACPAYPPWSFPSAISSPKARTTRPARNGRTSTSALRATMSTPSATSMTGSTHDALPMSASKPLTRARPTQPPFHPAYRTLPRNAPKATRPSPQSSGYFLMKPRGSERRFRFFGRAIPGSSRSLGGYLRDGHPVVRRRRIGEERRAGVLPHRALEHEELPERVGLARLDVLGERAEVEAL